MYWVSVHTRNLCVTNSIFRVLGLRVPGSRTPVLGLRVSYPESQFPGSRDPGSDFRLCLQNRSL